MFVDDTTIVRRLIIGEDLFGEIDELINFTKISSHQLKKYGLQLLSSNDIAKLNLSHILIFTKRPNIIVPRVSAQKSGRKTFNKIKTKYNSHQHFSFYSKCNLGVHRYMLCHHDDYVIYI